MTADTVMHDENYTPDRLFDAVMEKLDVPSDAAGARALDTAASVISKMRHKRIPVGAAMILRIYDVTGLSIEKIRQLLGVKPFAGTENAAAL